MERYPEPTVIGIGLGLILIGVLAHFLQIQVSTKDLLVSVAATAGITVIVTEIVNARRHKELIEANRQLKEVEIGLRDTEVTALVLSHISSESMRERRAELRKVPISEFQSGTFSDPTVPKKLEEVLTAYDRLAFAVHDNPRLRSKILVWMGESISGLWMRGKTYVLSQRNSITTPRPNYVIFLEALANHFDKHRKEYARDRRELMAEFAA